MEAFCRIQADRFGVFPYEQLDRFAEPVRYVWEFSVDRRFVRRFFHLEFCSQAGSTGLNAG